MPSAIKVQGLGKKYVLRHLEQGRRYVTLRDLLAQKAASLFRRSPQANPTREEFWALKDVSFEVKQGEAIGIIGRNGAGKSTLLKLLSRITKPTTGRIEIDGRVASLLEVGTGFHPELTGRENIYLNGAIMGMSRGEIRRKFDEIVAFAEIEKFLDTPVKHYSSGMYMRLAFAVSAHLEPEILIVDEVLAVGDAIFQKKCVGKMQDVSQKEGRTVLFVSHNMSAIQQLCTSGVLMEKGRAVEQGPIDQIVNRYLNVSGQFESAIDLGKMPRRWERDERIKLLKLNINDGRPVLFGESCTFTLTVRTTARLENVGFEIGFAGLDGIRFATFDSGMDDFFLPREPGTFDLQLKIESLQIQTAFYGVDVGAYSGGTGLDFIIAATQVEVQASRLNPTYRTGGANGVSLGGEWSVLSAADVNHSPASA